MAGETDAPRPFPWRQAMALGFGRLGLSSAEFWALTPRELAAAMEGLFGAGLAPLERRTLEDLMTRYPDGSHGHRNR
jgi:uncharacterized phage protein (TIGR02216 family)